MMKMLTISIKSMARGGDDSTRFHPNQEININLFTHNSIANKYYNTATVKAMRTRLKKAEYLYDVSLPSFTLLL